MPQVAFHSRGADHTQLLLKLWSQLELTMPGKQRSKRPKEWLEPLRTDVTRGFPENLERVLEFQTITPPTHSPQPKPAALLRAAQNAKTVLTRVTRGQAIGVEDAAALLAPRVLVAPAEFYRQLVTLPNSHPLLPGRVLDRRGSSVRFLGEGTMRRSVRFWAT